MDVPRKVINFRVCEAQIKVALINTIKEKEVVVLISTYIWLALNNETHV
jgi:hypothetical protein